MRSWNEKRNLKTFFFAMLISGGVFIASCEKDEVNPQPAVSATTVEAQSLGNEVVRTDTGNFPSTEIGRIYNGGATSREDSIRRLGTGLNTFDTTGRTTVYGTNGHTGY